MKQFLYSLILNVDKTTLITSIDGMQKTGFLVSDLPLISCVILDSQDFLE